MSAFDAYVFCDWSASSTPKAGRDSIWLCRKLRGKKPDLVNPKTRTEAALVLADWLTHGVRAGERTIVGYDFSLGLPAPSYAAFGLRDWAGYWEYLTLHIQDGPRNENNRFAVANTLNERGGAARGPFWGAPPSAVTARLTATKPPPDRRFPEFRAAEIVLRAARRYPSSTWQLLGNGSVGSQSLMGIPVVQRLRTRPELATCSCVWPFEVRAGDPAVRPFILHAEVWPVMLPADPTLHDVRDAAQVLALAAWATREDRAGRLLAHLASPEIDGAREELARVEGWVLGVA